MKFNRSFVLAAIAAAAPLSVQAADHAESLQVIRSLGADIADVFAFMDPNDASRVVVAFDVRGFIVPGENGNISPFDERTLYRFEIENTGDARSDKRIDIIFDAQTSRSTPQTAHVNIYNRRGNPNAIRFDAPTTVASPTAAVAPAPTVTTDARSGVTFFAGMREDPFFFDIPGFNRFTASATAGKADPSLLTRGRDTFAGYNAQMMALSIPVSLLLGSAGPNLGVSGVTYQTTFPSLFRNTKITAENRAIVFSNPFLEQIDRMGGPVINTVVIPFARKDEYNSATPEDDANGRFVNDIVASSKALGTNDANIGVLASLAITRGDYLRLDTSLANKGRGGGTNEVGFPNGRRPGDDTIDAVIRIVTNGAITTGDNVNGNDAVLLDVFPFFGTPNQPRVTGVIDDNTRN
jgi:hypothetical protein